MSSLVMDGVRRPGQVTTVFRAPRASGVMPRANIRASSWSSGNPSMGRPSLDGIRRPQMLAAAMAMPQMMSVAATAEAMVADGSAGHWLNGLIALPMLALTANSLLHFGVAQSPATTAKVETGNPSSAITASSSTDVFATQAATNVSAPTAAVTPITALGTQIENFASTQAAPMGIVITDLASGETVSHNGDMVVTSASLYKLFVANEIFHRIDLGQIHYNDAAGGGTGRTVNDCLAVMINVSDNACGHALGQLVGWKEITARAQLQGFAKTDLRSDPLHTTANDVAKLLQRLYAGTLLSPDSTQRFLGLLKDQRVNNRLPVGLPAGTTIAHKTGDLDGYMHDAGIVYSPKATYLITVTSGPWSSPGLAPAQFAALSKQVYDYFNK